MKSESAFPEGGSRVGYGGVAGGKSGSAFFKGGVAFPDGEPAFYKRWYAYGDGEPILFLLGEGRIEGGGVRREVQLAHEGATLGRTVNAIHPAILPFHGERAAIAGVV